MDSDLCNYDIQKRVFKVCSPIQKKVFVFMGLGFSEREKDISKIVIKIQKWIEKGGDIDDDDEKKIEKLLQGGPFKDMNVIKELFPKLSDKYNYEFIFDDMIYADDTCSNVLKKISQKCSNHSEDQKYIYASYINREGVSTPLGFKYEGEHPARSSAPQGGRQQGEKIITLEPENLITGKLCDIFDIENEEDHDVENSYENILDEYDIKDNMIYFINLEDFLDKHELNTIDFKKCSEVEHEVSAFKKRIIDKYWPQLKTMGGEMKDITDQTPVAKKIKDNSYQEENKRYKKDKKGTHAIHSNIATIDSEKCAEIISIDLFKTTKKQPKNINVDLYKLFTDFKLELSVPFVKWVSNNNANKYYKLLKDSIVYDGYGDFEPGFVNFTTCQAWIKDLYRFKKRSLEKINRYEVIQKDDRLSFKVFSEKNTYATLSIYIDGTIDFIIKKDEGNKKVSSKKEIIELIELSNKLIQKMNEENKYSETKIEDFGNSKEIKDIFLKNNIDFIDAKLSFPKGDYEVKKGENNIQSENNWVYEPPFRKGSTNLFIPILRRVCKELTMFFRYMEEDHIQNEKDDIIGLQYKRQSNFSNINTIQSLIKVYKDNENEIYGHSPLQRQEREQDTNVEIRKIIIREFNFDKRTIEGEIKSEGRQSGPMRGEKGYFRDNVVDENTPDITISVDTNYVNFEIRNMGSFMEFQRITSLINAIMKMFGEYVNGDLPGRFIYLFKHKNPDDDTSDSSEGALERGDDAEPTEGSASSSNDSSELDWGSADSDSEEEATSESEDAQQGGAGRPVKSYYLKRLKANDKELFQPKQKWKKKQKGDETKPYGYAKYCGDGNLDRKPISITSEEKKKIDDLRKETSKKKLASGVADYGKPQLGDSEETGFNRGAITIDRRSKDIHYICPQYWDIHRNIPLTKDYVDKHKKNVIGPTKDDKLNKKDKPILMKRGLNWDVFGKPGDMEPRLDDGKNHPEGYELPCCFHTKKGKKEARKGDGDGPAGREGPAGRDGEGPAGREVDGEGGPFGMRRLLSEMKVEKRGSIGKKTTIPITAGACSQLPMKLMELLSQDKIFEYDPQLSVSNGFVRKGVEQNDNDFRFVKSSFINSYIKLIAPEYGGDSKKYIDDKIITPLLADIKNYQFCPTLHKYFRKKYVTQEDNTFIIKEYLDKNIGNIESVFGKDKIDKLKDILTNGDISIESNEIGYIYSLLLSLKTYIDFLNSEEEKKDQYIIPAINSISEGTEYAVNIIIFEKKDIAPDGNVITKMTEQINSDKYCFMMKQGHYYEPIVYRVNIEKEQYEINILSTITFSTFELFKEKNFTDHLYTPYPRGRKENKLDCKGEAKHCTSWVRYNDVAKKNEGAEIRWIENPSENCRNSGEKKYAIFVKEDEENGYIITKDGKIKKDEVDVFVKQTQKKVDPAIERARGKGANGWSWIHRDCDEIHDKDIESLIRKKEDPEGDKLLLRYFNVKEGDPAMKPTKVEKEKLAKAKEKEKLAKAKEKEKLAKAKAKEKLSKAGKKKPTKAQKEMEQAEKEEAKEKVQAEKDEVAEKVQAEKDEKVANILKAMKSNFFIVSRILKDLEQLKDNKIKYHDGFDGSVRKHYINNYSEITHILYGDKLLPIKHANGGPIKMTPGEIKNEDIIYELDTYPEFKDVQEYIKPLKIERIAVNPKEQMICLFLESGFIPIKPEQITDDIRRKYDILRTEINPFEIDKHIMSNTNIATDGGYIRKFKKDNDEKHALFTKILNSIRDDSEIIKSIMQNIEHKAYIRKHKVKNIVKELEKNVIPKIDIDSGITKKEKNKLLQEFTYKLIISVENGDKISTINKIIYNVVKYSDLEKNTPVGEVFIKYDSDKEKMEKHLSDIFMKKSDFINIREEPLPSDYLRIKTRKLQTTPYYINKLFGADTSIVDDGGDWLTLGNSLKGIDIVLSYYANKLTKIKGIEDHPERGGRDPRDAPPIIKMILIKLDELNKIGLEEKRESFRSSYNIYNSLRYDDHTPFKNIKDIIEYWNPFTGIIKNKRINKPDIELILETIKEQNIHDFGVLLISFTKGKEMDIKFYGSDNVGYHTKVTILHHTLYKGDYILSNIIVDGKNNLTVQDLYNKSDLHTKWITVNDESPNKEEKLEVLREKLEKITLMAEDMEEVTQGITETREGIIQEMKELEEN